MKKLILILFVAVILSGCKKDNGKACWACAHYIELSPNPREFVEEKDICDKTEAEIREYENSIKSQYSGTVTAECRFIK